MIVTLLFLCAALSGVNVYGASAAENTPTDDLVSLSGGGVLVGGFGAKVPVSLSIGLFRREKEVNVPVSKSDVAWLNRQSNDYLKAYLFSIKDFLEYALGQLGGGDVLSQILPDALVKDTYRRYRDHNRLIQLIIAAIERFNEKYIFTVTRYGLLQENMTFVWFIKEYADDELADPVEVVCKSNMFFRALEVEKTFIYDGVDSAGMPTFEKGMFGMERVLKELSESYKPIYAAIVCASEKVSDEWERWSDRVGRLFIKPFECFLLRFIQEDAYLRLKEIFLHCTVCESNEWNNKGSSDVYSKRVNDLLCPLLLYVYLQEKGVFETKPELSCSDIVRSYFDLIKKCEAVAVACKAGKQKSAIHKGK